MSLSDDLVSLLAEAATVLREFGMPTPSALADRLESVVASNGGARRIGLQSIRDSSGPTRTYRVVRLLTVNGRTYGMPFEAYRYSTTKAEAVKLGKSLAKVTPGATFDPAPLCEARGGTLHDFTTELRPDPYVRGKWETDKGWTDPRARLR